jgi:hypothetical protein
MKRIDAQRLDGDSRQAPAAHRDRPELSAQQERVRAYETGFKLAPMARSFNLDGAVF